MIQLFAYIYTAFFSFRMFRGLNRGRAVSYGDYHAIPGQMDVVICYIICYLTSYTDYSSLIVMSIVLAYAVSLKKLRNITFSKHYLIWYTLFFFLSCINFLRFNEVRYGINMLLKLFMPIPVFLFTYYSIRHVDDIWYVFKVITKSLIFYPIVAVTALFFSAYVPINVYYGMMIFACPFVLFLRYRENKYLYYSFLCFSFLIVYFKRTAIMCITLSILVYFIFKYRMRAVFPMVIVLCLSIVSVYFITPLRERVFFEGFDIAEIDWSFVASGAIFDVINTSGRSTMWIDVIDNFYKGNVWIGEGPGTLKGWMMDPSKNEHIEHFQRAHNDWLQILYESGLIGVSFLLFMFCGLFRYCYKYYTNFRLSESLRLISLACAMVSITTIVHMFFENCLGDAGYAMPAFFSALLFRHIELERNRTY